MTKALEREESPVVKEKLGFLSRAVTIISRGDRRNNQLRAASGRRWPEGHYHRVSRLYQRSYMTE